MADELSSSEGSNFSRRGFLKGLGLGSVATGLASGVDSVAAEDEAKVCGPGETQVTLQINGKNHQLRLEPRVTLLDALRNRLDLTGAKKVCDRGTCGACTVLVDDEPVYSCSMLAIEAEGRKITTIEGLSTPEKLTPLQKAFVKHDAQQCGFCTPGFVLASTTFIRDNPGAGIDDVRKGLGGNLCRCGTYAGMMLAVSEAAQEKKGGA